MASAILDAFKFDYDHMYQFTYQNRYGLFCGIIPPYGSSDLDGIPADEISVGDLSLQVGPPLDFTYDFGDNWEFKIVVENIDTQRTSEINPIVLEKHGTPPKQYSSL